MINEEQCNVNTNNIFRLIHTTIAIIFRRNITYYIIRFLKISESICKKFGKI